MKATPLEVSTKEEIKRTSILCRPGYEMGGDDFEERRDVDRERVQDIRKLLLNMYQQIITG